MYHTRMAKDNMIQIQKYLNKGMSIPEIATIFHTLPAIMAHAIFSNKLDTAMLFKKSREKNT